MHPELLTTSHSQTQTDRLPDWTERAPGRGNYRRKTKCSWLSIFSCDADDGIIWAAIKWTRLPCGKSLHYVICEALELRIKEVDTIGWRETENRPSLRQEFPHGAPKPAETALQLTARLPLKSHSESSSKRITSSIYTLTAGSFSERAAKQIMDKRYGGHRSRQCLRKVWVKIGSKQRKRISEILDRKSVV